MSRPIFRLAGVAATVALLAAPAASPAAAQSDLPEYALADGEWIGVSMATGIFVAEQEGFSIEWGGSVGGAYRFTVTGDSVSGSWQLLGGGLMLAEGPPANFEFDLSFTGAGPVTGDADTLIMDGQSTTTGTVTAVAAQGGTTFPVNNTSPIPTLEMDVVEVCNEAYGDWYFVVAETFEDFGFQESGSLIAQGVFVAFQGREGFSELAAEILADAGFTPDPRFVGEGTDLPEVLGLMRALTQDFGDLMAKFPNWTYDEVAFTIDQANAAVNELRNLTDCELRAIGADNVERWISVLSTMVRQLVTGLVDLNLFSGPDTIQSMQSTGPVLPSAAWQMLVHLAARTGAIGPGAFDQDASALGTQQLIEVGSEMLEMSLETDGTLPATDHVIRVLTTGIAMGWTYTINGALLDPGTAFSGLDR